MDLTSLIYERLQRKFSPDQLEVINDSNKHVGHVGSKNGAGHYSIIISAKDFNSKNSIESHREIYHLFKDLIPEKIHALQIKLIALS